VVEKSTLPVRTAESLKRVLLANANGYKFEILSNPEFLAEAERTKLTVGPLAGEELQKLVAEVSSLTPELIEKVKAAYEMKK